MGTIPAFEELTFQWVSQATNKKVRGGDTVIMTVRRVMRQQVTAIQAEWPTRRHGEADGEGGMCDKKPGLGRSGGSAPQGREEPVQSP